MYFLFNFLQTAIICAILSLQTVHMFNHDVDNQLCGALLFLPQFDGGGSKGVCTMDRRIMKTKAGLKEALCRLLTEKQFENLTVTEICEEAKTGRLTFYKYYTDKKDLLEDCFTDIESMIEARYLDYMSDHQPQPDGDEGCNSELEHLRVQLEMFTDSVIDVMTEKDCLRARMMNHSGMLQEFCQFIVKCLEKMERENEAEADASGRPIRSKYPIHRINEFLAMGIWGFLFGTEIGEETLRSRGDARRLIGDLLRSDIFIQE